MILTLIATLAITQGSSCPVSGTPADAKIAYSDYNGVRVAFCCNNCPAAFDKDPKKFTDANAKKGTLYGAFLFDPVSGKRLLEKKAIKETSDYNGVRFMFERAENKAKFDADPKKYGALPEKEALYCPVGKEVVASYGKSAGYVDYEGVRYYLCCGGCEAKLRSEPASVVGNAKDYVKAPGIATEKK
jgi:YHS domain-containing protein